MVGWLCCLGSTVLNTLWWGVFMEPSCSHLGDRELKQVGAVRRRGCFQYSPSKHIPNDLISFYKFLCPKGSTNSQDHHKLAIKPLTHWALGDILNPNCRYQGSAI